MKHTRLLFLLFALLTLNAPAQQATATSAHDETDHKLRQIARVHDLIHRLPFTEQYIRETVLAEVKANRKKVAPHFPERHEIPAGASPIEMAKNWINNYPKEYEDYIAYVESVVRKYMRASK